MNMAWFSYLLCTVSAAACAVLLLRGYSRSKVRLLLWSGVCFTGLAISNSLLLVQYSLGAIEGLYSARAGLSLASISVLLLALVWDSR